MNYWHAETQPVSALVRSLTHRRLSKTGAITAEETYASRMVLPPQHRYMRGRTGSRGSVALHGPLVHEVVHALRSL